MEHTSIIGVIFRNVPIMVDESLMRVGLINNHGISHFRVRRRCLQPLMDYAGLHADIPLLEGEQTCSIGTT